MTPVQYGSELGSADTSRGPSKSIWKHCPVMEIINDPNLGIYFFDDFLDFGLPGTQTTQINIVPRYKVYNTGSGVVQSDSMPTGTAANQDNGVISMLCDTAGDQSVLGTEASPFYLTTTGYRRLFFEARIATTSILTAMTHIFLGLCNNNEVTFGAAIPLADADATGSAVNLFGFTRLEDGLADVNASYTDEAAVYTHAATAIGTLAANTWIKLGFLIDNQRSSDWCTFFVNGIPYATTLAKSTMAALTHLDVSGLGPCLATFADASGTAAYTYMDWWRVCQQNVAL